MRGKKYKHPLGSEEMVRKSVAQVREEHADIADEFLEPLLHPELPGFLVPNTGHDATPVKIEIQHGHIHTPDGEPHGPGETLIVPKYVADPWIQEKRVKRVR